MSGQHVWTRQGPIRACVVMATQEMALRVVAVRVLF